MNINQFPDTHELTEISAQRFAPTSFSPTAGYEQIANAPPDPTLPPPLSPEEALRRAHEAQLRHNQLLHTREFIRRLSVTVSFLYGLLHFLVIVVFLLLFTVSDDCDTPLVWYLVISTALILFLCPKRAFEDWLEMRAEYEVSAFVRLLDGLWFLAGSFSFCWFIVGIVYIIKDLNFTRTQKACYLYNPTLFYLVIGEMIYRLLYFLIVNVYMDNYIYWFITCCLGGNALPEFFLSGGVQAPMIGGGVLESELRTLKTFKFEAKEPEEIITSTTEKEKTKVTITAATETASEVVKTTRPRRPRIQKAVQVGLSHSVSLRTPHSTPSVPSVTRSVSLHVPSTSKTTPITSSSRSRHTQQPSIIISRPTNPTPATGLQANDAINSTLSRMESTRLAAMQLQATDTSVLSSLVNRNFSIRVGRSLSLRVTGLGIERERSTRSVRSNKTGKGLTMHANSSEMTISNRSAISNINLLINGGVKEEDEARSDTMVCAICVFEYENGEIVRELHCGHWFHMECVDVWLIGDVVNGRAGHRTCPLCAGDAVGFGIIGNERNV